MFFRLLAFLTLLVHINTSLLLPQVEERDLYAHGRQIDDINTLVEYVQQEVMDIADDSPEDEDNDKEQNYKSSCFDELYLVRQRVFIQEPQITFLRNYPEYSTPKTFFPICDVQLPPPKSLILSLI
jgi:hypothetical protein